MTVPSLELTHWVNFRSGESKIHRHYSCNSALCTFYSSSYDNEIAVDEVLSTYFIQTAFVKLEFASTNVTPLWCFRIMINISTLLLTPLVLSRGFCFESATKRERFSICMHDCIFRLWISFKCYKSCPYMAIIKFKRCLAIFNNYFNAGAMLVWGSRSFRNISR